MHRVCGVSLVVLILLTGSGPLQAEQAGQVSATPAGFWVPRDPPRALYRVDATVTVGEQASLRGRETIRVVNTTARPMQTIAITWSTIQGGSHTLSVTADGQPINLPTSGGSFPQDFVLAKPVQPGGSLTLAVEFSISMPTPGEAPQKVSLADWFPQLWWGCPSHNDFEVKLEVPKEYTLATSGRFDPRKGCYHIEKAPSFGIFLGKKYDVIKREAGDVSILCVYRPEDRRCAELLIDTAEDAIRFYRERFGFYPYRSLSIVPGMDRPAGGYPLATSIAVIHGMGRMQEMPEVHWRWIVAHEIAHQYWGRHVLEKDDPGWLWIGLGICMDREYCRARNLGTEKHRGLLARYIEGVGAGLDTTVSRSLEEQSQIQFDFNNVVIHGKGFGIISALDCLLGKETFQHVYRQCLKEYGGRRMGLSEFRAVCEKETGQDLGWFFDQWVNSDRVLGYAVAGQKCEQKGEVYMTEVQVHCIGTLRMPVPVRVDFEDGSSQQAFTNRLHDIDMLQFQSRSPLKQVRLDADDVLPLIALPSLREVSRLVDGLSLVGAGATALDVFRRARECSYADGPGWFRLGLALYDGRYYAEAMEAFEKVQICGQAEPARVSAAITWQGHLFDLLGQRDKAVERYKKALARPVPPRVRHDQYGIKLSREWIQKRIEEPFRRDP
jgi:hypothetical protein